MTLDQLAQIVNGGGIVLLVLVIGFLGAKPKPWWYFGHAYRALEQDRDEWKDMAIKGLSSAEKATTLAERATRS